MEIRIGAKTKRKALKALSADDAIVYYRQKKVEANGSLSEIAEIYTEARSYEQRNDDLAAIIATNRAIWEFINGRNLNLTNNTDRAIYLFELFEPALLLAAIGEE